MINTGYLFSKDSKRLFINTSLGCNGDCIYCYLPRLGYSDYKTISHQDIIKSIEGSNLVNTDTLISIGCFSECWDNQNKAETISLIKYFLKKGNQIQLSTKCEINSEELIDILPLIKYYGQLVILISSATISKHDSIEKNTTPISNRFRSFENTSVPMVLYIKPVLKDITINDLNLYKKYINKYKIKDTIVGSIFTTTVSSETVPFSDRNELFYTECSDEHIIASELSKITKVYKRSTEVMKKYKKQSTD